MPSCSRVGELSACWKRSKITGIRSSGMPAPVSATENSTKCVSRGSLFVSGVRCQVSGLGGSDVILDTFSVGGRTPRFVLREIRFLPSSAPRRYRDRAGVGELDRVVDQAFENLLELLAIRRERNRRIGRLPDEREIALPDRAVFGFQLLEQLAGVDALAVDPGDPRFDFRRRHDAIDHR